VTAEVARDADHSDKERSRGQSAKGRFAQNVLLRFLHGSIHSFRLESHRVQRQGLQTLADSVDLVPQLVASGADLLILAVDPE
jgi:hypothetical protein